MAKRTVRGTDFLVQLGGRIRKLRQEHGWTQLRLAEEVGLHRSFIADVERGGRNISILNLLHIATALGFSLSEILARLPSRTAGRPAYRRLDRLKTTWIWANREGHLPVLEDQLLSGADSERVLGKL